MGGLAAWAVMSGTDGIRCIDLHVCQLLFEWCEHSRYGRLGGIGMGAWDGLHELHGALGWHGSKKVASVGLAGRHEGHHWLVCQACLAHNA